MWIMWAVLAIPALLILWYAFRFLLMLFFLLTGRIDFEEEHPTSTRAPKKQPLSNPQPSSKNFESQ